MLKGKKYNGKMTNMGGMAETWGGGRGVEWKTTKTKNNENVMKENWYNSENIPKWQLKSINWWRSWKYSKNDS